MDVVDYVIKNKNCVKSLKDIYEEWVTLSY